MWYTTKIFEAPFKTDHYASVMITKSAVSNKVNPISKQIYDKKIILRKFFKTYLKPLIGRQSIMLLLQRINMILSVKLWLTKLKNALH